jgi:segregation and condensation protein B
MEPGDITLPQLVEALVFASPEPLSAEAIVAVLLAEDPGLEILPTEIDGIVTGLNARYATAGLSFHIRHAGGGYGFATLDAFHPYLVHIQHENASRKLSASAIETLAIMAYKQPLTKPEVDAIRGVDSGYIIRQLLEKKLVDVAGRKDAPGKPLLYRTSATFLRHFGINSVDELPKPREIDEILKDDDMAEHRQLILELRQGLGDNG